MPTLDVSLFLNSLSQDNRNSLLSQSLQMLLPVGTALMRALAFPTGISVPGYLLVR